MTAQVPTYRIDELRERRSQVCIVVPVVNEGARITGQLSAMARLDHGLDVVIADGGSNDGSLQRDVLSTQGVRTLLTKIGAGALSAQLRMAFDYCLAQGYTGIITIDGNAKDGVEAIPSFRQALEQGYDFVQGSRFISGGRAVNTPVLRYWAIRLLHAPLISVGARRRFTDTTNGFRAHSATFLADARVDPFRDVFDSYELLAYLPVAAGRIRARTTELPVSRTYPPGESPTKIRSFRAHVDLLAIALKAASGGYLP